MSLDKIIEVTGEDDIQRLDREIDHLREVGLINGGFDAYSPSISASIEPLGLALHMFVRCQGSRTSPIDFFDIQVPSKQVHEGNNIVS